MVMRIDIRLVTVQFRLCELRHGDREFFECFAFASFLCFIEFSGTYGAGEACGTVSALQLYCPTGYHCCYTELYTCCATGYVCASIAAIIIPIIIVIVIIVVIIAIIVKKKNARQGVVINPGNTQGTGNPSIGYNQLQGSAPF